MKYADEFYFEKTLEFITLRAFLRNQKYLTKGRADEIAYEIQLRSCIDDSNIEFRIYESERLRLKFDSSNYDEFVDLCIDVDRNTRKHMYCGHTHNEIF